ncbi:PAS domain S-box protein [Flammeovirga sp. MY04]|uniref:PAS domain-containing sensor histidine kinase n=1 Tax=Flammeovirga sp. MY04 TaxID=1191459 RepID=UPI0008063481|nr:PAS domain S-box protein [Flammeovirga sp. MY04]ANQ50753.1 PAS domain S-box protein [Flammeovirga sp. MY04]
MNFSPQIYNEQIQNYPFLIIQKADFLLLSGYDEQQFVFSVSEHDYKLNSFFDVCPIEWQGIFRGAFKEVIRNTSIIKELYDNDGNKSLVRIENEENTFKIFRINPLLTESKTFNFHTLFDHLLETTNDAIAIISSDKKMIKKNIPLENLLERLIRKPISLNNRFEELLNKSKRVNTGINKALNGEKYQTEVTYLSESNDLVFIRTDYSPIHDYQNNVIACLVKSRDVTARNSIEDMFSVMLNSSNTGYVLVSDTGKIIKINKHLQDLLGYKEEEFINRDFVDFVHSTIKKEVQGEFSQLLRNKEWLVNKNNMFLDLKKKDNDSLLFELENKKVILSDHKSALFVTLKNITLKERNSHILHEMQRLIKACGWVYDRFSKKMLVTEEVAQVIGVSKEFVEKNPTFLLNNSDETSKEQAKEILLSAFRNKTNFNFELKINSKFKGEQWVRLNGKPIVRHQRIVGLYGALQDITEQKHSLNLLKRNESYIKEIQRVTKVGNWVFDVKNNRFYWSDHLISMLRLKDDKHRNLSLKAILNFVDTPYLFPMINAIKKLSLFHEPIDLDIKCNNNLNAASGIEFINIKGRAIYNRKGEVKRFVGAVTDITARKNEEELNKSKKIWLKSMLNAARDSFIAEYSGRIANYNRGLQKLLGYNHYFDLRGMVFINLFYEEDQDRVLKYRQQCRQGDISTPQKIEVKMVKRDNSLVDVELCANLTKIKGKLYTIFNAHDISKRKEYEMGLLHKNKELIETNKELDRFLYSTTHDLKGPITSLRGLVNLGYRESSDVVKDVYLPMMDKNVDRMLDLISDFGEYLRNNRKNIVPEEINLKEQLETIIHTHKFSAPLNYVVNINMDEQLKVVTDKYRFRSILTNLYTNAIKYYDREKDKHYLDITASLDDNESLILSFVDNGEGISKHEQTKVFDMFYRASEQSDGTGLGLFIVKEAINVLNGEIHLKSDPNSGTNFTVSLPKLK